MPVDDNDVQFEEDSPRDSQFHIRSPKILGEVTTPTVINFLLERNVVKNEKQATVLVLLICAVFLIVSGFIIRNKISSPEELMVINKYGQEITFDEYIAAVNRGEDPIRK